MKFFIVVTRALLFLFSSLAITHSVVSADLFRLYDLEFKGRLSSYHVEDLNNDGLKDILLFLNLGEDSTERWLSIYFQSNDGFLRETSQAFRLPDQVILFDIGDVSGDLKKEFVFFARGGIFYYCLEDSGFALNPLRLFDTESIFMLSDKTAHSHWDFVGDLNGDHIDEVLVPKITTCDIHFRNPKNNDWLINTIPLRAVSRVRGFYDKSYSVGSRADAVYSTAYLVTQDFNRDGRKDLMGVYEDSLFVYCQNEQGFFSQRCHHEVALHFGEIWRGGKIQRTRWGDRSERFFLRRLQDLNDDGILDVLSVKISTKESVMNPRTQLRIHYGKIDRTNSTETIFFAPEPDQIIRPGGTLLVLSILDLNHDSKLDMVVPIVRVGLTNIIRMLLTKTVEIQAETYLMKAEGFYPEKPNAKTKMIVKFSFRGGATSPVYEIGDFNGDGYPDILSSLEQKRLVIFWGNERDIFETKIGAKFNVLLPQDGEMVRAMDLNRDDKCDVLITYDEDNTKHTYLTSTLRVLLAQ